MSTLNIGDFSSQHLSRVGVAGLALAAGFSPLWFFTIGGVNLNPADFIFLAVFGLFVARTGIIPFSPSRTTAAATFTFLVIAGLSILWTPQPRSALLSYFQYLFIFVGVVPITSHALRERATRWWVFVAICLVTNGLALLAAASFIFGEVNQLRHVTLWYGNQNQLFWLISSAWICNIALIFEPSKQNWIRAVASALTVMETVLIFGGRTISAILVLIAGIWLFTAWISHRRSKRAITTLMAVTFLGGCATLIVIAQHWSTVYIEASLHVRIPQYLAAIEQGVNHFPLGAGLDSSAVVLDHYPAYYRRSIHNFFLAYFLELGIVGAGTFLVVISVWLRDVLVPAFQYSSRLNAFEFAFVVIFGTYILVILFQPVPVHRYWWMMFGASWAVIRDLQ